MITKNWRHDCLIVDAGIRHHDTNRLAGGDETTFETGHLLGLAERAVIRQINTTRISNHRNDNLAFATGDVFHECRARVTK